MESSKIINVPLRSGGKKMRKRRELDALIAHSGIKRSVSSKAAEGVNSQDKLLSASTDDAEEYPWTKSISTSNYDRFPKYIYFRICIPLILIIGFIIFTGFIYWLYFDLHQQIYDYRLKIEEVAATTQNIPETLQKWHETSSNLVKNQSVILNKLNSLKMSINILQSNFTTYKSSLEVQNSYEKSEKLVADFGARIEAVSTDVESIKEHYNNLFEDHKKFQLDLSQLHKHLMELKNFTLNILSPPSNFTELLITLKSSFLEKLQNMNNQFIVSNNTLNQKIENLHEELSINKAKIYELFDRSENITSHVTSIENSWTKYRQKILGFEGFAGETKKEVATVNKKLHSADILLQNLTNTFNNFMKICKEFNIERIEKQETNLYTNSLFNLSKKEYSGNVVKQNRSST